MKKQRLLRTPEEFDEAINQRMNIEVWRQGKIIDYGGQIQIQTTDAVMINDAKYSKTEHEFRIR